jgi:phosphoglycolate phosphatase-like HAD superfamily hydrolase
MRVASSAPPIELLVLDFDGVLVESNGIKTAAFRDVFARFPEHQSRMLAFHEEHVSLSRYAKFEYLVGTLLGRPGDDALVAELAADFSRRVVERVATCVEVPGAHEFLAEFAARVPTYLASVTPDAELREILDRRGLRRWFADVFGFPPQSKRAAVESVIERHGVDRAHVMLIGDSQGDLEVAREAGVQFIARNSGLPFDEPGLQTYPDLYAIADIVRQRIPTRA